jgi:hypothetical protein
MKLIPKRTQTLCRFHNLIRKLLSLKFGVTRQGEIVPGGFDIQKHTIKVDDSFVLTLGIYDDDDHSDWQKFRGTTPEAAISKACNYIVSNYEV